ncbi:MAG: helix-turn-helix domain-containing protein [Brumimicrobium sp.]|nr:helix-turn-helix domain-containing protein [Brumimicrobium sp.]
MNEINNPFALLDERLQRIEQLLTQRQEQGEQTHQSNDEVELLTPKETAEFLKISLPTLHRWQKKGKVKCYGISGSRYYKRSELLESLTELK